MIKLGKIHNDNEIEVFEGSDTVWARSNGYVEIDVIKCNDNIWRLVSEVESEEFKAKELVRAKALKLAQIDAKAYEFEDKGLISYEGVTPEGEAKVVQIETTDKNIGKINGLINMFNAQIITEYLWSTKDDTPIVLHSADCYALTGLFAEFSAQIWMVKQPGYKAAVEACGTVEEVAAIEIEYTNKEVSDENTTDEDNTGVEETAAQQANII